VSNAKRCNSMNRKVDMRSTSELCGRATQPRSYTPKDWTLCCHKYCMEV